MCNEVYEFNAEELDEAGFGNLAHVVMWDCAVHGLYILEVDTGLRKHRQVFATFPDIQKELTLLNSLHSTPLTPASAQITREHRRVTWGQVSPERDQWWYLVEEFTPEDGWVGTADDQYVSPGEVREVLGFVVGVEYATLLAAVVN